MDKRTSEHPQFTVRDPRLTAVDIQLIDAEDTARDLLSRLQTAHERCHLSFQVPGILDGLEGLVQDLGEIQKRLSRIGCPANPERLRQVVLHSLRAQS